MPLHDRGIDPPCLTTPGHQQFTRPPCPYPWLEGLIVTRCCLGPVTISTWTRITAPEPPPTLWHTKPCQSDSGWRPRPLAAYSGITIPRSKVAPPPVYSAGGRVLPGPGVDIDSRPWILLQGP